ncbi:MAG: DUF2818 family protein [Pseudomonadota bacterium]
MSQTASIWIVIAVALLAANLPFMNERVFGVIPLAADKPLAVRFAELVVMYFITGAIGLLLENHAGQIAPQGWEFYAVTGAFFITLAFPGFVWRYLHRR